MQSEQWSTPRRRSVWLLNPDAGYALQPPVGAPRPPRVRPLSGVEERFAVSIDAVAAPFVSTTGWYPWPRYAASAEAPELSSRVPRLASNV